MQFYHQFVFTFFLNTTIKKDIVNDKGSKCALGPIDPF